MSRCERLSNTATEVRPLRRHWRIAVFVPSMMVLLALAVIQVRGALNPLSLRLDDQWVAALVKHASFIELLELSPPVPVGFILLLQSLTAVLGWGSWQLQALPLLFGLAQIPLIGWIAWRATGHLSLGIVAAALLIGSRTFLFFSVCVKQYTLESLIVLILIALAMTCVQRPRTAWYVIVITAAIVALPFSFTSVPVGMVVVNVLALHILLSKHDERLLSRSIAIGGCVVYNAAVLVWLWVHPLDQANELMFEFWAQHYVPLHDPTAIWTFINEDVRRFFTGAVPSEFGWLVFAVPVSIILLSWRRSTRLLGVALLLFFGGMFVASALELYPIGGRRTDIFSYPITILAIIGALWALARTFRYVPHIALCMVVVNLLLFYPARPITYPESDDREIITQAESHLKHDDALILSLKATYAVGCYGSWPVKLVRAEETPNGFIVVPQRGRTLVVRESMFSPRAQPNHAMLVAEIQTILDDEPPRIVYIATFWSPRSVQTLSEFIESHGYKGTEIPVVRGKVLVFEHP